MPPRELSSGLVCQAGGRLGQWIERPTPNLVVYGYEERTRMRPMRQIHPTDFEYGGPSLEEA